MYAIFIKNFPVATTAFPIDWLGEPESMPGPDLDRSISSTIFERSNDLNQIALPKSMLLKEMDDFLFGGRRQPSLILPVLIAAGSSLMVTTAS